MSTTAEPAERTIVSSSVSPELRRELEALAEQGHRSLSGEIRKALYQHLALARASQEER